MNIHEDSFKGFTDFISEFINEINSDSKNKMKLIENFERIFFSKKISIKSESIWELIHCLIFLCGDEFVGRKALDFISKLTAGDYYRDFAAAKKDFLTFSPDFLKNMKLNEYLTKKRFGDSQIQAYGICKIIEEALGLKKLQEIVLIT